MIDDMVLNVFMNSTRFLPDIYGHNDKLRKTTCCTDPLYDREDRKRIRVPYTVVTPLTPPHRFLRKCERNTVNIVCWCLVLMLFGTISVTSEVIHPSGYHGYSVNEGSSVTIPCYDTDSATETSIARNGDVRWYGIDGQFILQNNPLSGPWHDESRATIDDQDTALRIYSTRLGDAGSYMCIRYLNGKRESREIQLIVHDGTPEIDPVQGGGVLSENDTLSLTCRGGFLITWNYPDNVASRVRISIQNENLDESIQSRRQTSTLTIENVIYTDTGKYQCAHDHHSSSGGEDEGDALDEVYIYVIKAKDSTTLFIPSSDPIVSAFADDQSTLIPCRVTNPIAKLSLVTYQVREDGSDGAMQDIRDIQYDPQQGFVIPSAQFDQLQEKVRCVASMGVIVDHQDFTFNYIGQPDVEIQHPSSTAIIDQILLITESDKSMQIACSGQLQILWSYPITARQKITVQTTAILNPVTNTDLHYRSVLTLHNISSSDTGEYSCVFVRYVGTPLEMEQSSAQYVYITSTNISKLFLPETNLIVKVHPNEVFTVPCRISDPKYQIDFAAFYTTAEPYDLRKDRSVTYDPRVGFTFGIHEGGKIIPNLNILCADSQFDVTTDLYVLLYVGDNNGALFPRIFPSSDVVIQGQTGVNVTCEVSIEEALFSRLTEDFHPQFDLSYPGQKLNSSSSDYAIGEIEEKYNATHIFFCYALNIEEVSLADMGTYTCEVYNVAGRANTSTELTVLEQGYVDIQNKSDLGLVEVINGSKDFCQVHFEVEAFPTPVTYVWSKDGKVIDSSFKMDMNNPTLDIDGPKLCISLINVMHEGNYTVLASNQYQEDSVTIQLIVLVKPTVTVTTKPEPINSTLPNLIEMDEDYLLTCSATGNPIPTVWWEWFACEVGDDKCEPPSADVDPMGETGWKRLSTQELGSSSFDTGGELEEYQQKNVAVEMVKKPRLSGFYRCVAESPKFDEMSQQLLEWFLTEIDNGFAIEDTDVQRYESEQVELSCKASIYAFKYLRWKRRDPVTNETVFVIPPLVANVANTDDRIKINNGKTSFSHQSELVINFLNSTDDGQYFCIAKQKFGPRIKMPMSLTVKDLIPPLIVQGLSNITKLDKSKSAGYQLSCMASGEPKPDMVWRKDGLEHQSAPMMKTTIMNVYQSTFTLSSHIRDQDGGVYTCEANNIGGADNSSTTVLILESPTVSAEEQLVRSKIGKNATLACRVSGKPIPTLTWMHTTIDDLQRTVPDSVYRNEGRMLYFKELTQEDAGVYECIASNELGQDEDSIVLNIEIPKSQLENFVIPVVIVAAALIVILILLIIIVIKKWCAGPGKAMSTVSDDFGNYLEPSQIPLYMQDSPYDPRWEFPRERLQLGPVIGKGAFGQVVRAVAVGIGSGSRSTTVAIKMLREDAAEAEYKALMDELKILIHIGRHLNVVNFLGACTQQVPILIIVEYCRYGNLCHYLRSKRQTFISEDGNPYSSEPISKQGVSAQLSRVTRSMEDLLSDESQQDYTRISDDEDEDEDEQALTTQDLVCYSFQIARGMEFLASKKCIHRDLAARNVLVADHNIVKICDFGLSRNLYYDPDYIAKSKSLLPIKWMAPESIFDKVFTTQSDVWSFGIVMWEVFCLGGSPYPGFQVDERFYEKLKYGYRMSRPDFASADVYQIMLECWQKNPKQRPVFGELVKTIGERLQDGTREEYMDLEAAHEKDYWEIPESIQSSENKYSFHNPPSSPSNDAQASAQSVCSLDQPPEHPPLPAPRTMEKYPKYPKQTLTLVVDDEDECTTPDSPAHAVLVWKNKPPVSSSQELVTPNEKPSPSMSSLDPARIEQRQRPLSSADGRRTPVLVPNGRQRPVTTLYGEPCPVSNKTTNLRASNLEMCKVFFPSNDDMNMTCPMIANPVLGQQISPKEECSPLLIENKETLL